MQKYGAEHLLQTDQTLPDGFVVLSVESTSETTQIFVLGFFRHICIIKLN